MRQTSPPTYPPEPQPRHGLQYISRQKQPSMFEILTWKEKYDAASDNQWLLKFNHPSQERRFTEQHKYERPALTEAHSPNSKDKNRASHRQLKQGLYDYGDDAVKKRKEVASPKQQKEKNKKEIKKLSKFNEEEKKEIEIRKKNIQQFNAFTRQLPNSAFTTYFGKPAFEHYGHGAASQSVTALKSHSVMPHAGKNHPEEVQSHEGALKKANVINIQSHVPRMKVQSPPIDCKVNIKQYYNIQIVKHDLINEVRFANQDRDLKYKSKTPRHNELNFLPKRQYKSPPAEPKKPKRKRVQKSQDKIGKLAFMNGREGFMREVSEKKKMQNRLAYKVTECHPYNWDHETEAASTAKQEQWRQVRPAGVSSSRSLHAYPLSF